MQPSQPAQSSSSKRRHSSAEPSQTQTGASAIVPLEPTTNASKRSKKDPVVSASQGSDGTPPAEENWWTDRKIDWEKDCGGEDQQSSFAYFKDWIPTGISYMSGAVGGYTLKRGAKEFQRFLYEKKGPIKRSVKSIEAKYNSVRKGWKTAYNLTQQTGAGDGGIITIHTPTGDADIPYDSLADHRERYCPDYNFWNEIFQSRQGARPLFRKSTDDDSNPSLNRMSEHVSRPHKEATSGNAPLEEPRSADEGTSEDRQRQSRSIHGDNDNDDLQEEGNPCHEEDGGDLSSRHPLLEKSIRKRLGHPRRPHGQPASEMSEEGRKVFEEDVKLRREAAQRDRDREVREMARAKREDEHWAREAVYFEKQNDLSEAQRVYYERKTENEEAETAARIASEMKISLQEALSVLRRSRAVGKDK
ncbi:hypothetical protein C365_05191 [Cryptococcus neoformans Bt85]|nr:hypothetical protein C365_05191 [Cryptococcus neoformans var. grubii Bt85]